LPLSGCRNVEFAAHLGESLVEMFAEIDEVATEVDEVLAKGVEACGHAVPELAELTAKVADVAVGGTGEYTRRRGVLLTGLYASGQVADLDFESGDARFEIPRLHAVSLPLSADDEMPTGSETVD
jgi:hypothetical protein